MAVGPRRGAAHLSWPTLWHPRPARAVRGPAGSPGGRQPEREPPDLQLSLGLVPPYGGTTPVADLAYSTDWEMRHFPG